MPDGRLVPLLRAFGRTLQRPVERAQEAPDMTRVILHAGHALDHQGDARQRPQRGTEALRAGALAQGRLDAGHLLRSQARLAPCAAGASQSRAPASAPRLIPPHHALAADSQAPRDRALRLAAGPEQSRGLLPTNFQSLEIPSWRNMSGHASIVRCAKRLIVTVLCETQ